jgi:hypothetical protein
MGYDLASLPQEVGAHLARCEACRQWQRRLWQIEANVPLLPVPASARKEQCRNEILHGPATLPRERPPRWRRLALPSGGLAAAAVLVAAGVFLGNMLTQRSREGELTKAAPPAADKPSSNNGLGNTFAGRILDIDLNLAAADTQRRRVETLARLAQTLHGESRSLAAVAGPDEMQSLAKLYGKVVNEGIVARARKLPPAERRQALHPIADQLALADREAEALAKKTRPEAAAPLLQIAAVARAGDQQLRALIEENIP